MSNVNTDQRLQAAKVAPQAPASASVTYSNFAAGQPGAGTVAQLPIPGQWKAVNKKVKVRLYFDALLATQTSQTLTVAIAAVNAAGTVTPIATTGAGAAG